jgi:hypothetical protein
VREALCAALIGSIVVRERDDMRPAFSLYDASATAMVDTPGPTTTASKDRDMAEDGLRFASRPLRWS